MTSKVFGEFDGGVFTLVGDHDVPEDEKDFVWCWHLHDEVDVMRYGHELGEHRSSEDSMIGRAEVRDLECQVFCVEVLLCAKGDR
jgi:hypothetical protein